jgi:hypothetical protein
MSMTISMRGRWAGSAPRLARRFCGLCPALGSRSLLLLLAGGFDLFGFLEPQQKLILGKRLGPSAEAVTLQFLDDLDQTGILDVARQDHCFQRVQIVGKLVCRHRHGPIRPDSPAPGDDGIPADSLGRGSPRRDRNMGRPELMNWDCQEFRA